MTPGDADEPFWEGFGPSPVILDGGLATELDAFDGNLGFHGVAKVQSVGPGANSGNRYYYFTE